MHRAFASLALLALISSVGPAAAAQSHAFVACTDFITGALSVANLDTRAVALDVESIHLDAALRWYDGKLVVINRFGGDNIQIIDPATHSTIHQWSTGPGSNPQDIAFVSPTKAYVSRYELGSVLILNPANGATLGTISLAAFADADGIPEMAHMVRVDRWLFVALQRLDRNGGFQPTDTSLIAVIDTQADTVLDVNPALPGVQAIVLQATNPSSSFAFDRATTRLLIGCTGAFGALDGGIEAIDPVNFQSLGLLITESALGGDVGDIEWNGAAHSYAIVSDASFNTNLVAWSAVTGTTLGPPVFAPGGFSLTDCAINDRGELYVCSSDFFAPGLFVFRANADTLIAGPIDCGLPPNQVTFDATSSEVLDAPGPRTVLTFSAPRPNPARDDVRFTLSLPSAGEVRIDAFDLAGRRVATLAAGAYAAGDHVFHWNMRETSGTRLSAGVYLIRARTAGLEAVRRIVVTP